MSKTITLTTDSTQGRPSRGYLKISPALWALFLLLGVFTAGCKKDDFKDEIKGVCPVVVSTDPLNNAVDVVLEKVISATFNTDMDPETINRTTFTIKQGTTVISGKVAPTASAKTFTFDPDVDLLPFTKYTGTITTGAQDPLHTAMVSSYVWTFTTIPEITLSAKPVAGGTVAGAGKFAQGSSVTVTATPLPTYFFVNWTENGVMVATTASYSFAMAGNKALEANFALIPKFTLAVSATPAAGGTTTGDGIFENGTSVTATANPKAGYSFVNWTEGNVAVSTLLAYNFPLTANRTLVANFKADQFTLVLSALPVAGGTTAGGGLYESGSSVTATAIAKPGYTFVNWTENGVAVSANANLPFRLTANRTLVANFKTTQYTLGLSALPAEGGTVTGDGTYDTGTSVTATAQVKPNYRFVNWTEDGVQVSTDANYQFVIAGNRMLVANFSAIALPVKFSVMVSANPPSGGMAMGNGLYDPNTPVTVTATTNAGYIFEKWTENNVQVSTSANYTFTIVANRILVANFSLIPTINPIIINLGTAADFVILTKSGISTTGITSITGDIGVSPAAASSITGFPLTMDPLGTNSFALTTDGSVVGKVYAADYSDPTPDKMTTAISDMETAFTTTYGLTTPAPVVEEGAGNISGLTLRAGIYKWSTGVLIDPNTSVTLNGSATDVWVFQIAQNLTVSNSARVVLQGNAQAKNVYWVVTGQATLGTNADFSGIILSKTLISLNTGARVKGRLLAQTAVTLNASTVTLP